jgi:PAS domain S-box-containing protein
MMRGEKDLGGAPGRFLEQKDVVGQKGFIRRKYGYDVVYFFLLMGAGWLLSMGALSAFKDFGAATHYVFVTLVFAGMTATLYFFIANDRDVMHALEFQNALFSAVTRHSYAFYAILRHDGKVVYIHPEYHRRLHCMIADGNSSLEALCKIIDMDEDKRKLMMQLMREGKKGTFRFSLAIHDNHQPLNMLLQPISMYTGEEYHKDITLVLEPISRPSGFFLLIAEHEGPHAAFVKNLGQLGVGYFMTDEALAVQSANSVFASMGGYTKQELAADGVCLSEIIPEMTPEAIKSADSMPIARICAAKNRKTGETEQCMALLASVDAAVYKAHYMGIAVRCKRLPEEAAPNASFKDVPEIVEHSPIPVAVTSTSGKIVYCNKAFPASVGATDGAAEGQNILNFLHPEERNNVRRRLEAAAQSEESIAAPLHTEIAQADGTARPVSLFVQPVRKFMDKVTHLAVYVIDMTNAKQLEQRLAHSQKMQAIGQLAGGIAHDFNNLLTAMLGFCDLLLARHPAGDESFGDVMQIRQNANRAAGLVRQLLAFSRRQTLRPKVIDVTDCLADLSDLLTRLLGENIALKMRHARGLKKIRVDVGQFEQVIVNLAVNARDAMGERGALSIETDNVDVSSRHPVHKQFSPEGDVILPGSYVCIRLKDAGCGIARENLQKIFEPFFSTKEVGAGTGLGLATVYGIVKQTNGYIYVDSTVGKGTEFSIFFPEHVPSEEELAAAEAEAKEEEQGPKDVTGKGLVLLVEDEAPVRMFSSSALKSKGYDVLEAENGFEALGIMEERGHEIDVIVTDVVMPGMNGPSMIEQVHRQFPDVKVIFISGYSEDQFMEHFKDKKLVDFLPKPYNLKQLATKVKEMTG